MALSSRVKLVTVVVVIAALAVPAWYLISPSPLFIPTVGEEEPQEGFTTAVAMGTFIDGEPGHYSSGRANILTDGSSYVLRFEEFSVTNGPGLHVYLAKGEDVSGGDVDLGPLKASQGSSNYAIPNGVEPRQFGYVVIWCVPFSVQFGFAPLILV